MARKGIAYVRQSTKKQVREKPGSAEYQRGLARHLQAWGWSHEQSEIVEDGG